MQEILDAFADWPTAAIVALVVYQVVVVAAVVWALVDLARRPEVVGGKKWVWLLVILFVSSGIGVLLYALIGRRVPESVDVPLVDASDASDRARAAVDVLYGEGDDK